ncbi:hypothetical protein R3P38DRAFT_2877162 [Favolaschia claudopus]|uniref:Uncharacterized protein n=1 Tax=Favolaschia claudopus TaxID=2862362 RepID=A0AAW0D9A6_9AGAR
MTECATLTLPASARCVSLQFSATSFNIAAQAPRSSSTGQPLAGPTQVLSPRLLFPATVAGAPNFQSLDGVMMGFVSVVVEASAEDGVEGQSEHVCGKEQARLTRAEWEAICVEDRWGRWRYEMGWKLHFAVKRVRRLF